MANVHWRMRTHQVSGSLNYMVKVFFICVSQMESPRSKRPFVISRARPTLNLPCITPQNSVTRNGQYRRPIIKAQPSFPARCRSRWWIRHLLTNGVIFSTLKHINPHTVRGRPTQKDGVCNEHIFRNGLLRELKIAKESNDLADLAKVVPQSNEFSVNRKNRQNVATDDRGTFTDKDKVRHIQALGNDN